MLGLKETRWGTVPRIAGLPPGARLCPALVVGGAGRTTLGSCFQKVQIWVCEEKARFVFVVLCEQQYLDTHLHTYIFTFFPRLNAHMKTFSPGWCGSVD